MKENSKMSGCEGGLIDVTGLCNPSDTTEVIRNTPYWKQMHITESLQIPEQKPDVEQINSVDISVQIQRSQVIKTPRSYDDSGLTPEERPNLEGRLLSGRKLIIEGQLCQKIGYTALEASQPLHSAHFFVPFSSFIIVPEEITFTGTDGKTITEDSYNVNFDVNFCVEDVTACVLDKRNILKQVTFMLYAVPTRSGC